MTDWTSTLCNHIGVHAQYRGFDGQTITVSQDTQIAVLRALDLDVGSDADAREQVQALLTAEKQHPLRAEVIVEVHQPCELVLAHPAEWVLEAEGTGATLAEGAETTTVHLPALPLGIHRLRLVTKAGSFTTSLLARPAQAVRLEDHVAAQRIWGVLAALYGLTDGAETRIGTYDLLGRYAAEMGAYGADFLGINPVHAMGQVRPDDVISPYSPSHRAFLNTWHCASTGGQAGDAMPLVNYPAALQDNEDALARGFAAFSRLGADAPEVKAFRAFTAQGGIPLHEFALFEALAAQHGADWRDWPAPYRTHDATALAAFEAANADPIQRTKWAQWQAESQLSDAQSRAIASGMRIGLYLDLAVGPRLGGAETWVKGTTLVTGASLGAPPDPLGPKGQNWGLAPQSPMKCRADGYAGFARLLRSVMRHSGMIRIDHVLGLMRSFWIPEGGSEGTYVSYPFDALLAVVAIESARNDTIVVGEDLGLVPEGLREKLAASGIYGLDVLQYMRTPTGGFTDTAQTRQMALCTFATHDTPTTAGFFAAEDAHVRHQIGGMDQATLDTTRKDRLRAQETLAAADPVAEVHRRLASANASMVAVQLDDIAGQTSQHNLPGTVDSYPNWRLKAPFTTNEIATSQAFAEIAGVMRAQNRSNPKAMEKEHDLQDCSDHTH